MKTLLISCVLFCAFITANAQPPRTYADLKAFLGLKKSQVKDFAKQRGYAFHSREVEDGNTVETYRNADRDDIVLTIMDGEVSEILSDELEAKDLERIVDYLKKNQFTKKASKLKKSSGYVSNTVDFWIDREESYRVLIEFISDGSFNTITLSRDLVYGFEEDL